MPTKRSRWLVRAIGSLTLLVAALGVDPAPVHASSVTPAALNVPIIFSVSDDNSPEGFLFEGPPIRRLPGEIAFQVSLNVSLCCQNITVQYRTADGTARAPGDYTAKSGTLTFTPGTFARDVVVTMNFNPGPAEPNETFRLELSNPSVPADVSDVGIGTIIDGIERIPGD